MDLHQRALSDRLEHFQFDEDARPELPFADRLARENEWTADHAQRVLREYRRFLLLCVTAGHPVTPSDAVDQAWHLHMIYTRSYWDRLCGQTLGQPVHHGPTRGGANERAKFNDWYERTLESYRRIFSEPPPRDIWPNASERFAASEFIRVDRRRNWVIPRPRVAGRTVACAAAALSLIVAAGCTTSNSSTQGRAVMLIVFALSLPLVYVLWRFRSRGGGGSGCGGGGCGGAAGCGAGCGSGCGGGGGCGGGCGS